MKLSSACCVLGGLVAASGVATAGGTQNAFELGVDTQSWMNVIEGGFVDEAYRSDEVYRELDSLFGLGDSGSFVHNTGVEFNGQSALSTNVSSYAYDESGFEAHSVQHSEFVLGSGYNSGAENQARIYGVMVFDVDTVVDVFVRVDYSGINGGTLGSYFELEGVTGVPITGFEIEDPAEAGFYEIAMQVEVLAGDAFALYVEGLIWLDAMDSGTANGSGDLSTSVVVRVVPAPGGAAVFAGAGLVASRRRRGMGGSR
ncbi:MAG: hypothetical protein KC996_01640 [Phycisphaerales bacterium]|nr:hypothetical protein [Phycisphaerales bacterium]